MTTSHRHVTAHGRVRDHDAFWNFWLSVGALVPPAGMLCFVFVTDDFAVRTLHITPDSLRVVDAAVGLGSYVCALLQVLWKSQERSTGLVEAIDRFEHGRARDDRDMPRIRSSAIRRIERRHARGRACRSGRSGARPSQRV